MYSLPCASPLPKLYKLDTTEVDHFELLDDNRKLIFSGSPHAGQIFTAVSFSGIGMYPEHAQLAGLGVHRRFTGKSTGPTTSYEYYFHVTPTGLVLLSRRSTAAELVVSNDTSRTVRSSGGFQLASLLEPRSHSDQLKMASRKGDATEILWGVDSCFVQRDRWNWKRDVGPLQPLAKLKVKLQGHTGWIRGNESFAALGLPPPNDPAHRYF